MTDLTVNTESPGLYLVTPGPTDSITPTIISATGSTRSYQEKNQQENTVMSSAACLQF